jgi:nucleoid DNA-binding protein
VKRSELIEEMAREWDRPERETRMLVDEFFESIARVLERDGRLELRGFGVFELKEREATEGRIPGKALKSKVRELSRADVED